MDIVRGTEYSGEYSRLYFVLMAAASSRRTDALLVAGGLCACAALVCAATWLHKHTANNTNTPPPKQPHNTEPLSEEDKDTQQPQGDVLWGAGGMVRGGSFAGLVGAVVGCGGVRVHPVVCSALLLCHRTFTTSMDLLDLLLHHYKESDTNNPTNPVAAKHLKLRVWAVRLSVGGSA